MESGRSRDHLAPEGASRRSWSLAGPAWVVAGAAAVLLLLVGFLGVQLAGSGKRVEQLRAELRSVYAEAESLRSAAAGSQQRVIVLEQQLRQLRTERETLLKRLRARTEATPPRPPGDKLTDRRSAPRPAARPAR